MTEIRVTGDHSLPRRPGVGLRRVVEPIRRQLLDPLLHLGIEAYARGLEGLDFGGCPEEFVDAFAEHREAWRASVPFFERHADLRGELHDVFETIRGYGGDEQAQLERHEEAIWSTWAEVEAAQ